MMNLDERNAFKTIFLLLFVSLLFSTVDARCPDAANEKIQYCVQPVSEYAKILNQQDNNTNGGGGHKQNGFGNALQLPKLGGQVFQELCRLIRSFELCVDAYRDRCLKHITINLIEASYGYLCNEGYETFMASAECLMELDQQPAVKHCHDETLKEIEEANVESTMRMEAKMSRMCGALNYFSACVRHHIRQRCGGDAWHVIFRVLKDTTKTLMSTCTFNGESAKLEAERRAEEHNRYARTRRPHSHPLLPPRTTAPPPDDFAILPTSSMYSSTKIEDTRSLEAERDEEMLNGVGGDLRPPQPQRDDQPISFEIHEEIERPPDQAANYERFSLWSHSTRSQSFSSFLLILLSSLTCFVHRIFVF